MMTHIIPILYTFRRCPYAMRGRMALAQAGVRLEWREILLRDKPEAMLEVSPKGTVPVLVLPDGQVIDESLDVMLWALSQNDHDNWLPDNAVDRQVAYDLIARNDGAFKQHLDRYKYSDRHPERPMEYHREQCAITLAKLDRHILRNNGYLVTNHITLADMAIFPFIRQCAHVDKEWFYATEYKALQQWLNARIESDLFQGIMNKYPQWKSGDEVTLFP